MKGKSLNDRLLECIEGIEKVAAHMPNTLTIHDLINGTVVWISERGLKALGISANQIVGRHIKEFHHLYFNPKDAEDYVPKIVALLERNDEDEVITYFEQVRLNGSPDLTWHMSSVKILLKDEHNVPIYAIASSIPIDAMHHMTVKASRLLEENNFLRNNYQTFALLSMREREILKFMALGKSSADTADELFISIGTVDTHRKNIKKKLKTQSYFQLCMYARAFDLY
ncbi:PAS and helix-turn-helix domain-containing protein [Pedobacter sp. MC2016-14]|uniref:PAS and helix-turn-helix domain-containing protein n=1 Tax=Pedobacter sp. MC2016-14 TaxID=2897327 RepID=UPI001E6285B3|nr:PAS and helix-turn-helix domain-containing protein [Pedobacter sp. MC2016-14]MCD0489779.1 PAS and helix-turn-helix domain-containing protein [Pedobacter sp. MC2016-14]